MFNPYAYQQPQIRQPQTINPYGYNPMMQQEPPKPTDDRIYVQGLEAAKAYLVAPNGFVRLWDSTAPVFYEKVADTRGVPSLMAFKYEAVNLADNGFMSNKQGTDYDERLKGIEERLLKLEGVNNEQSNADV